MTEPLITYGYVTGFNSNDPSFCVMTDGFFVIEAYVPLKTKVQVGRAYSVYKQGTTYFVGTEVNVQ